MRENSGDDIFDGSKSWDSSDSLLDNYKNSEYDYESNLRSYVSLFRYTVLLTISRIEKILGNLDSSKMTKNEYVSYMLDLNRRGEELIESFDSKFVLIRRCLGDDSIVESYATSKELLEKADNPGAFFRRLNLETSPIDDVSKNSKHSAIIDVYVYDEVERIEPNSYEPFAGKNCRVSCPLRFKARTTLDRIERNVKRFLITDTSTYDRFANEPIRRQRDVRSSENHRRDFLIKSPSFPKDLSKILGNGSSLRDSYETFSLRGNSQMSFRDDNDRLVPRPEYILNDKRFIP